jgi:hypothetical protein
MFILQKCESFLNKKQFALKQQGLLYKKDTYRERKRLLAVISIFIIWYCRISDLCPKFSKKKIYIFNTFLVVHTSSIAIWYVGITRRYLFDLSGGRLLLSPHFLLSDPHFFYYCRLFFSVRYLDHLYNEFVHV